VWVSVGEQHEAVTLPQYMITKFGTVEDSKLTKIQPIMLFIVPQIAK